MSMSRGLSQKPRLPFDEDYDPGFYGISLFEPSLTQQSDAAAADINNIVRRWQQTGVLPTNLNDVTAQYADVSDVPDYHACLEVVTKAQNMFLELPSDLRERFKNDPAEYLSFCSDPSNLSEMVSLGLAVPRPEPSTGEGGAAPQLSDPPPVGGSEAP